MLAELPAEAARVREAGAGALEIPGDLCVIEASYGAELWRKVAPILSAEGLGATVHLPFIWTDLAALDAKVWEGSLRSVEQAAEALAPLQPRLAAVHPANFGSQALLSAMPGPAALLRLAEQLTRAVARLKAGPLGSVLGLENLEHIPWDLFRLITTQTDARVCFDIGHALSDGLDPVEALESVRDRVVGIHLHDALPGKAHLPLGEGKLDLPAMRAALSDVDLPVVFELDGDAQGSLRTWLGSQDPPLQHR